MILAWGFLAFLACILEALLLKKITVGTIVLCLLFAPLFCIFNIIVALHYIVLWEAK